MSNVSVGTFAPAQDHSEFAVVFSAVHEPVWDVSVEPWASGSNSSLSATSIAAVFLDIFAQCLTPSSDHEAQLQALLSPSASLSSTSSTSPRLKENSADPDTGQLATCGVGDESDGVAKFEAAVRRNANKQLKNEIQAYEWLREVQGALIPRLYAVMRLPLASEGLSEEACYLDVYVIILQAISGPTLEDLPEKPSVLSTEQALTSILQHVFNARRQLVVK
ncbi:Ff.00g040340.m01.CDS01 [Fusarium sp. VM40]|nr:Ff.00g040340.m01.CDS01 [Fusarium sp. VM40]